MFKKIAILLLVISLLPVSNVFAFTVYESSGSAINGSIAYNASADRYILDLVDDDATSALFRSYGNDSTYTTVSTEKSMNASDAGGSYYYNWRFSCNVYYELYLYNSTGDEVGYIKFHATEIKEPICDSTPDTGTPPVDEGTCTDCGFLDCPGWGEYMGKVDDIISAIPPAPNWDEVAATFRDVIAPRLKSDLQDVLGRAPTPPSAPRAPTAPDLPSALDDGGLSAPTGKEATGLGDSSFNENDIKDQAPVITERQDPTGGFTIEDPLGSLPSQDEFKQNIPEEGTAPLPVIPEKTVPLPLPPVELEKIPPAPPEATAPLPAAPVEQENTAPVPEEPIKTAPTPTEPTNTAPIPAEGENTAPVPEEPINTAPVPGDTAETAPVPTEDGSTAPLPGTDGSTAPIPGDTTETAPLPNDGT